MRYRKICLTSALLAAAVLSFAGCHKGEEKQTETQVAGTKEKEPEATETEPDSTEESDVVPTESTGEGNTTEEKEESGYFLTEFLEKYYKRRYTFPEEAIPEDSSITFGKYEQDGNIENGPEPVEWIILNGANWDDYYIPAISKSVLDVLPVNDNQIDYEGFLRNSFNEFYTGYIVNTPYGYFNEELPEELVRLPLEFGEDERGFVGDGPMLPLFKDTNLIPKEHISCEMTSYASERLEKIGGTADDEWLALGYERIEIDELVDLYVGGIQKTLFMNQRGSVVTKSLEEKSIGFRPIVWISRDYFLAKYMNVDFSAKNVKREMRSFHKVEIGETLSENEGFTRQMEMDTIYAADLDGNGTKETIMVREDGLWLQDDDCLFFLMPQSLEMEYFGTISLVDFDTKDGRIDICISCADQDLIGYKFIYRYEGSKLNQLCSFSAEGAYPKLVLKGDSTFQVQTILKSFLVDQLGTLSMQYEMKLSESQVVSLNGEDEVLALVLPEGVDEQYFHPRINQTLRKQTDDGQYYEIEADSEKQYIPKNITYMQGMDNMFLETSLVYVETGGNEENDSGYIVLFPNSLDWILTDSMLKTTDWTNEYTSTWFDKVPKKAEKTDNN